MKLRSVLIPLASIAAMVITGCSSLSSLPVVFAHDGSNRERYDITARDSALYGDLLKAHADGQQRALRVRLDTARDRLWVLALEHVYIYDLATKQLLRRVVLPDRSVAGFVCLPDIALDRSGSAFISSNVESRLWKINAQHFGIETQEITLHGGANRDIGFGALAFAGDGALFALTAHEGSLWRIDVATMNAREVGLSQRVVNACTLTAPDRHNQRVSPTAAVLCAASEKQSRHIVVTPDFARGHILDETCAY